MFTRSPLYIPENTESEFDLVVMKVKQYNRFHSVYPTPLHETEVQKYGSILGLQVLLTLLSSSSLDNHGSSMVSSLHFFTTIFTVRRYSLDPLSGRPTAPTFPQIFENGPEDSRSSV